VLVEAVDGLAKGDCVVEATGPGASGSEPESPNSIESTSAQPVRPKAVTSTKATRIRDETPEIAARPANFIVIAALQIRPGTCPTDIQPACAFGAQGPGKSYPPARAGTRVESAAF
jgi:hypothetical protein